MNGRTAKTAINLEYANDAPAASKPLKARRFSVFVLSLVICVSAVDLSCTSKPTDLRTLVPTATIIYLETNDLSAALDHVYADASPKPDLGQLKGVQVAIAVTDIELSEKKISNEQSSAEIKPKFVAVIDTHAWHFQAVHFAEEKLGSIVEKFYGSKPAMQDPERNGGRDITWTAPDGRKAFAFVAGGIVYFSNDRDSLDKALEVRSGAASLAAANKLLPAANDILASGYASSNGISQIADVIAVKAAGASEDPNVRSGVAAILPQLVRELVVDIAWTEKRADQGVTDRYVLTMPGNVVDALKDTKPGEFNERIRNTVLKLLERDPSPVATKLETAEIVSRAMQLGDPLQNEFTADGITQVSTSRSGLLDRIADALGQP